ncbi:MAG: beta-ketoacyl-[acyl-carrier-protein] synthase family protein [Acidimicrobiales bacterium]
MTAPRRVVVTGFGVVGPCGHGRDGFWSGLLAPQPEGERRTRGFDPAPYFTNPKEIRRSDLGTQLALAVGFEALQHAGLASRPDGVEDNPVVPGDPERAGVILGTGIGGLYTLEDQILTHQEKGARRVSPFLVPMMMANAGAAAISMRYGFRGPCEVTVTACAASTHAIGNASRLITSGRCDMVLTGGYEASMTPVAIAGFTNMTALSSTGMSRPFDARRDGFVMAEGAAALVLEDFESAHARGATILGEVLGAASTADAHHITAPAPGGSGAVSCMELALADAGLSPSDIAHINAHGTSTPLNDAAEAEGISKVFGTPGPPVTSTKGVTGHALGAAGALEAVAVLLSMEHRLIPPTDGTDARDPELPPIDLVIGEPRPWTPGPTLSNSFGFGGHNGCVVLGPPPA